MIFHNDEKSGMIIISLVIITSPDIPRERTNTIEGKIIKWSYITTIIPFKTEFATEFS